MTESLSIDEVCLSKGELYTVVTNKREGQGNKSSLVAMMNGTDSKTLIEVLMKLPIEKRNMVTEMTLDMARSMGHTKERGEKYKPQIFENGDTLKELLARSKYLFYKFKSEWTINQMKRAAILFNQYPILKQAYDLVVLFRNIYKSESIYQARLRLNHWIYQVKKTTITEFNTCVNSLEYHLEDILAFFVNRETNANAESFNAKIKQFRSEVRGVSDVKFFLFRLEKLFAQSP